MELSGKRNDALNLTFLYVIVFNVLFTLPIAILSLDKKKLIYHIKCFTFFLVFVFELTSQLIESNGLLVLDIAVFLLKIRDSQTIKGRTRCEATDLNIQVII